LFGTLGEAGVDFRDFRNFRKRSANQGFGVHPLGETAKLRTVSRAKFLQGVSAGFRHTERRKPAAAAPVEMIDIVDESDAPDCCREFPPFLPVVLLPRPKGGLQPDRDWRRRARTARGRGWRAPACRGLGVRDRTWLMLLRRGLDRI